MKLKTATLIAGFGVLLATVLQLRLTVIVLKSNDQEEALVALAYAVTYASLSLFFFTLYRNQK